MVKYAKYTFFIRNLATQVDLKSFLNFGQILSKKVSYQLLKVSKFLKLGMDKMGLGFLKYVKKRQFCFLENLE